MEVFANLGDPGEAAGAVAQGAEGVGLLRTEFLFLDRDTAPTEDEQVALLEAVARGMDGRPVVVRTLDAGADKPLPFLAQAPEDNPFLGVRGIRLSLAEPALFRTQLRAILRVAAEHPLAVMFPMVATLDEFRRAKALLEEERAALGVDASPEVGVMVEVPSLALDAAAFAAEVDFFSVGTNDLAQYAMAAERGNAALAPLLDGRAARGARADRPGGRRGRGARPLGRRLRGAGRRPGGGGPARRPRRARAEHGAEPDPGGEGRAAGGRSRRRRGAPRPPRCPPGAR